MRIRTSNETEPVRAELDRLDAEVAGYGRAIETAAAARAAGLGGGEGARSRAGRVRPAGDPQPGPTPGPGRPAARPRRAPLRPAQGGGAPARDRHGGGVLVGEPPAPAPGRARRLADRRLVGEPLRSGHHPGRELLAGTDPGERRRLGCTGDEED